MTHHFHEAHVGLFAFAAQAGHSFTYTTFFVVEIFAGRFAAISKSLLSGGVPCITDLLKTISKSFG